MIKWWALTDPKGKLVEGTFGPTKSAIWENGYWAVAAREGDEWREKYWKRWDASIRSARRLGYKFVRVNIVPAKR